MPNGYPVKPYLQRLNRTRRQNSLVARRSKRHRRRQFSQTLRDIYALTNDQDIRYKCRMAMAYSKAMHSRLKYYHDKYEPEK